MKRFIISVTVILFLSQCYGQSKMKTITKNGMTVNWEFKDNRIYFEMTAPTDGWVAIGFNNIENITGNYLIMGKLEKDKVTVEEHYTISLGNYQSFNKLKINASVENVEGVETAKKTTIKFSLPIISNNKYAKDLNERSEYILLIAYSQEDDFQHHSIMRTSSKIIL
jgi:hypothetical protein